VRSMIVILRLLGDSSLPWVGDASPSGMETLAFPDSLCARILKAKYYSNSKLLDRAPASESSQTWWAVEYGLELLKQGVIHRIGDGRSTHFLA
jgi:hypothetical protein